MRKLLSDDAFGLIGLEVPNLYQELERKILTN